MNLARPSLGRPLALFVLALAAWSAGGVRPGPSTAAEDGWVCPPCGADCHDRTYPEAGSCSSCGMELVLESSVTTVAVLLYEGVDVASWTGPLAVFATAGTCFVRTVADTTDPLRCGDALTVVPDRALQDQPAPDVLVLPSGFGQVWDDELFMDWIAEAAAGAKHVLAIGSGGMVAARAGLLPGGELAVGARYARFARDVVPEHTLASDRAEIADGKVLSLRDASAALEASYALLAELEGEEVAARTAERLGHER